MTPEDEALADTIADIVAAAVDPLQMELKTLQAALGTWESRWQDIGLVRERVAVLEVRGAIPGPPGPVGDRGEKGQAGSSGRDGERGEIGPAGAEGPRGERGDKGSDGLSVKGEPGAVGPRGEIGPAGQMGVPGLNGKDGADLVSAMLDRDGQLIVTLSNGQTKAVGCVVGRDGRDGTNGREVDALMVQDTIAKAITHELATWPKPKDGQDGKDGAPGLSPDDFDWDFNDETRALTMRMFRNGLMLADRTKILTGMRIYRGVYEAGRTYEKGDDVSWDGSVWTATAQTSDRPGNGKTPWILAVKHGEKGARGADGKPGRDGKDINVPHVHFTGPKL